MEHIKLLSDINNICTLSKEGKLEDTIKTLRGLLNQYDENECKSIIYYSCGLIYEGDSRYGEAIDNYEKAINLYGVLDPLLREYKIYTYENKLMEALFTIDRMIEIQPTVFLGYDLKFNFLFQLGCYDEAETVLKLIEDKFNESSIITLNKVRLDVMLNRLDEATSIIENEINNNEIHYDLLVEKAKVLSIQDKIDESIEILSNVHLKYKDNIEVIYLMGSILMINGRIREANNYFKKLLDIDYSEEVPYILGTYYYGVTLKALEESCEVQKYFKWLYKKYTVYGLNNPNDLNVMVLKSMLLYELQDLEKSLKLLDKIDELNPHIIETYFVRTLIYKKMGDSEKYLSSKLKVEEKSDLYKNVLDFIQEVDNKNGE